MYSLIGWGWKRVLEWSLRSIGQVCAIARAAATSLTVSISAGLTSLLLKLKHQSRNATVATNLVAEVIHRATPDAELRTTVMWVLLFRVTIRASACHGAASLRLRDGVNAVLIARFRSNIAS